MSDRLCFLSAPSQLPNLKLRKQSGYQVGVDVSDTSTAFVLRATGSDVKFPGFLAAFGLADDDASASDDDAPVTGSQAATLNALQVSSCACITSMRYYDGFFSSSFTSTPKSWHLS